ncbi:MAG TPA: hypothetical protein VFS08_12070 [Gemmatimonadaceae bacterium]|nr:hypothetical protein [Gemmatimonadaceae bacterium]
MPCFLCTTCGTQFADATVPPTACPICDDERQYVPAGGQRWTTLEQLRRTHRNAFQRLEPGLYGIGTEPRFAIGQRALLVRTSGGNVLWDCITLLDDATVDLVQALGGLRAVAISHPHFYTTMVEWAHAFGCPVLLHADDRAHVMRPDPALHFWDGEALALDAMGPEGLTLVRCGGHFDGSTVLHWAGGAGGRGALLSGDTLQVVEDRRHVSFMRSYPNLVPLDAARVRRVVVAVEPYAYERIYGGWWDRHVECDAQGAVARSAARYLAAIAAPDDGGAAFTWRTEP